LCSEPLPNCLGEAACLLHDDLLRDLLLLGVGVADVGLDGEVDLQALLSSPVTVTSVSDGDI
jgi:hypothetical protein